MSIDLMDTVETTSSNLTEGAIVTDENNLDIVPGGDLPEVNPEVNPVDITIQGAEIQGAATPVNGNNMTGKTKNIKFSKLFSNGCSIFLDVSCWSATTKISPSDLGIPITKDINDALNLGSEKLLPKEVLAPLVNLRGSAHSLIQKSSASIDAIIPGGRFIPKPKIKELEAALAEYKVAFYKHLDENVYPNYDKNRMEQLEVLNRALKKAVEGKPDADNIVKTAITRIVSKYPTLDHLKTLFKFRWERRGITPDSTETETIANTLDLAAKESEAAEAAVKEIIGDYGNRVKEMAGHLQNLMAEGRRPTGATLNSITKLRQEVAAIQYMGGKGLVEAVDNLYFIVNKYIEADKQSKEAAESMVKEAAAKLTSTVDGVINESINVALDYLGDNELDVTI